MIDFFSKATFSDYSTGLPCLQYVSFHVRQSYQTDEKLITTIMRSGFPSLRRISVNEVTWEVKNKYFSSSTPLIFFFFFFQASWRASFDTGTTELDIRRVDDIKPPWERKVTNDPKFC
jgi:hypothetical protein